MTGRLPSPEELVTALQVAGFEYVHHGRGYVRYRWPAGPRGDRSVLVLTDPADAGYPTMVAVLLAEMDDVARCGQAATLVLDLICPTPPEAPGD